MKKSSHYNTHGIDIFVMNWCKIHAFKAIYFCFAIELKLLCKSIFKAQNYALEKHVLAPCCL